MREAPAAPAANGVERLVAFGRALRAEGLPVGTGRIAEFCRATALAPDDLYWAGRATLVARHADIGVYDRVFRAFFGDEKEPPVATPARPEVRISAGTGEERPEAKGESEEKRPELVLASEIELLRRKSFARCTPEELAQLAALMARVKLAMPMRRTRRRQPARAGAPDLRRTLRRSFRTGGEPLERAWRERRRRRRRLVLILDVSGSMASHSRALIVFAHAALKADPRWEAFCFGTRLTRLTKALATTDPDEALERAAADVFDWDGGTRIGESLERFLADHAQVARGSVVVICSDGLEVGDPHLLAEQMARLSRLAYRIVWLNPLKEDPAYEPLARGMRAALPYIDVFASGHNLASLEQLGAELARM